MVFKPCVLWTVNEACRMALGLMFPDFLEGDNATDEEVYTESSQALIRY